MTSPFVKLVLVCTATFCLGFFLATSIYQRPSIRESAVSPLAVSRKNVEVDVRPVAPGRWPRPPALDFDQMYKYPPRLVTEELSQTHTTYCRDLRRFGEDERSTNLRGHNGHSICLDTIPQGGKCLVYSFGINYDFSVDDELATKFQCEVHSFDPSMKNQSYTRPSGVHFYKTGISDKDAVINKDWTVQKISTIMKQLGHDNAIIDLVKMDVEGHEWSFFEDVMKNPEILSRIRQFDLEFHYAPGDKDQRKCGIWRQFKKNHTEFAAVAFDHWHETSWQCHLLTLVNTNLAIGSDETMAPGMV